MEKSTLGTKLQNYGLLIAFASMVSIAVAVVPSTIRSAPKHALESKVTAASSGQDFKQKLVVSKDGTKYHLPDCKYMETILATNVVVYTSRDAVEHDHYQPCGVCFPTERHARARY